MKKRFFAFIVFVFSLVIAFAEEGVASVAEIFSLGEWKENVYTNDFLGITYQMPDGWIKYGEEEMAAIMNLGKEFLNDTQKKYSEIAKKNTVYYVLTNNPYNGNTMSIVTEKNLFEISPDLYLRSLKGQLNAMGSIEFETSDIEKKEIAGREYSVLKATASVNGMEVTQLYCAYKINKYILVLIATSRSGDEGVYSMLEAFK